MTHLPKKDEGFDLKAKGTDLNDKLRDEELAERAMQVLASTEKGKVN